MIKKIFSRKKMAVYLIVFFLGLMALYFLKPNDRSQSAIVNERIISGKEIKIYPIFPDAIDTIPNSQREVLVQNKMEERASFIKTYNKSIEYHGQILDQFNQPVGGVSIVVGINRWNPLRYRPSSKKTTISSDLSGKFSIQGEKGLSLKIESLTKAGYTFQYVPTRNYRRGGQSTTSQSQPDIIQAYKISEIPEKLLIGNVRFHQFIPDGRMYSLDLIKGQKQEGKTLGQIRVAYNYTGGTLDTLSYELSDWSVSLEVNGGGVIETTDKLMFEAPETGYRQRWTASFKLGSSGWKRELKRNFYLKAQNGRIYGRLEINFAPFFNVEKSDTYVGIKYWLNPQGSRNLYSTKQPY